MRKLMIVVLFALSASAEPKNVKLLTGLSEVDMQRTMNLMRSSLGVHCDYCHVIKKQWDFPSDENPRKDRAREMIRMVADINRATFAGHEVVSCFTCHRGSVKPVNLVTLPQTAPKFPTPRPEQPQLDDAKEIVKKYAAVLGDVAMLKTPRVLKGERTAFDQKVTPFELVEKGAKVHIHAADREQVFNGESGWWRNEKESGVMAPREVDLVRVLVSAYAIVLPADIGDNARTIAKEKINDREVWVVENGTRRFYFDIESGLLVRAVILTPSIAGTIPQQTDFEDYRDAGGVKFPFRTRLSLVDPWLSATRQYTSVTLGAVVDDSQFEMPSTKP